MHLPPQARHEEALAAVTAEKAAAEEGRAAAEATIAEREATIASLQEEEAGLREQLAAVQAQLGERIGPSNHATPCIGPGHTLRVTRCN